jgi:hypothetical protein
VLSFQVFAFSDGLLIAGTDVVNRNVSMRVTNCNQVRILFRELAAGNGMLSLDDLLREIRVFQGPEAQHALLKGLSAVNIILSITNSDQIWVRHVNINA